MLTAKIITAALLFLVAAIQILMQFWWHDKRTRKHRNARNFFVVALLLGTALNGILLAVDEAKNESRADADTLGRTELENGSLGGLTPSLAVFLYRNSKLFCPYIGPTFPDSLGLQMGSQLGIGPQPELGLIVDNSNSFPIFDVQISLMDETPDLDNTRQVLGNFPEPTWNFAILNPHAMHEILFPLRTNFYSKGFTFNVTTRRGETQHRILLALSSSNNWEYASSILDLLTGKMVSFYSSPGFPRDTNGNPSVPIITQIQATASVSAKSTH